MKPAMLNALHNNPPPPLPHKRQIFLDWLRIIAFALLVVYHVGMYYVSWDWHIKSPQASAALEPWMRLLSPWRLGLLFLVSGAATSFMLLRQGASGETLRTRAKRLLIPLLLGIFVIVPPQAFLEVVHKYAYAGGYVDFMRLYLVGYGGFCAKAGHCLILPTWNHLWFLPYLFIYTALLWLLLRRWPGVLDALALRLPRVLGHAWLLVLPVVLLASTRYAMVARFPVTHALVDDWFAHTQFFALFMLGAVLARASVMWDRMAQQRWVALLLAVVAWAMLVVMSPATLRPLLYSVQQWCAIVAALGFARRFLNHDSAARRYLTEAVFPVYILHQTLTILLAQALLGAALPARIEGPLLVVTTFVLSFAGFEVVRRVRWARPLFGLNSPHHQRTSASVKASAGDTG